MAEYVQPQGSVNQASGLFPSESLSRNLGLHQGERQDNDVSSPRRTKARRIPSGAWEEHKQHFTAYYCTQGRSLTEVIELMALYHHFHASPSQYESKFNQWGLRKHKSRHAYEYNLVFVESHVDEIEHEPSGGSSTFSSCWSDLSVATQLVPDSMTYHLPQDRSTSLADDETDHQPDGPALLLPDESLALEMSYTKMSHPEAFHTFFDQSYDESITRTIECSIEEKAKSPGAEPSSVRMTGGLSSQDWLCHRPIIERLYFDEMKPLTDVVQIMRDKFNFDANTIMYEDRILEWGFLDRKAPKKDFMHFIADNRLRFRAMLMGEEGDAEEETRFSFERHSGITTRETLQNVPLSATSQYTSPNRGAGEQDIKLIQGKGPQTSSNRSSSSNTTPEQASALHFAHQQNPDMYQISDVGTIRSGGCSPFDLPSSVSEASTGVTVRHLMTTVAELPDMRPSEDSLSLDGSDTASSDSSFLSLASERQENLSGLSPQLRSIACATAMWFLSTYRLLIRQAVGGSTCTDSTNRASDDSGSTDGSSNRSSKRKANTNNTDDVNEQEGDKRFTKKRKVCVDEADNAQLQYACPFNKQDSFVYGINSVKPDYRVCGTCSFVSIAHLKQHLQRTHYAPETYCLRCSRADFPSQFALEQHMLIIPACEPRNPPLYRERISHDIRRELKLDKRNIKGTDPVEYWFRIFDALFPDVRAQRRISPYYAGPFYQQQNQFVRFCRTISPEVFQVVCQRLGYEMSANDHSSAVQVLLFHAMLQEASDQFAEHLSSSRALQAGIINEAAEENASTLPVDTDLTWTAAQPADSIKSAVLDSNTSSMNTSDALPAELSCSVGSEYVIEAVASALPVGQSPATPLDVYTEPTSLDTDLYLVDESFWDSVCLPNNIQLDLQKQVDQVLNETSATTFGWVGT